MAGRLLRRDMNDPDVGTGSTKVARIGRAIAPIDERNEVSITKICFYRSGVRTGTDQVDKLVGGGISASTSEALHATVSARLATLPDCRPKSLTNIDPAATAAPLVKAERQPRWTPTAASAAAPTSKIFDLALRH